MLVCRPAHAEDGPLLAAAPALIDALSDYVAAWRDASDADARMRAAEAFVQAASRVVEMPWESPSGWNSPDILL